MSKPIPRRLLPHFVIHSPLVGVNAFQEPTYSTGVTIKFVRVEFVKKNLLNSQGENKDDKATLFVDSKNSTPAMVFGKDKGVGDKITYKGTDFTIREIIEECGDSEEVHHLEVALV